MGFKTATLPLILSWMAALANPVLGQNGQSCNSLQEPVYALLQCTGNQLNDECVFQCDPGYVLNSADSEVRRCVCPNGGACYWTGQDATCILAAEYCPVPSLVGNTYSVIDVAPEGAIFRVTVAPTETSSSGWSALVIFPSALDLSAVVESFSSIPSGVSPDRRAFTFSNRDYNKDISGRQQYAFTFIVRGNDLMNQQTLHNAIVGFYETPVVDGSCFLDINPVNPLPTTSSTTTTTQQPSSTSSTSSTTTTTPVTTTTTSTTTTTTTTTQPSTTPPASIPAGCQEISYSIDNAWMEQGIFKFSFRYRAPTADWSNWVIKISFDKAVTAITAYTSKAEGPMTGGLVWFFRPMSWNQQMQNQHLEGNCNAETTGNSAPGALAIICNNGVEPDTNAVVVGGGGDSSTTSTTQSTTTTTPSTTISSTTITPPDVTGQLPDHSAPTQIDFLPSSPEDLAVTPYDYNEILHKSILFYEAQRSGKLPATNRIPWRGDSGLKDGCYGSECIDLTGGWYDAGDYVKFGFPMASTTTVLAWGMIEFRDAYEDAEEWKNALDMLKWATDYFIKAHVSQNELYVQVGDPDLDHQNWGHPETMTMSRPAFKIDASNPGSEVAAETAAALAASYLVFKESDPAYASQLLNHAMQLFDFAFTYRGDYHQSVPKVERFYRSWSGFNDELVWASMWLHRATGDEAYLTEARDLSSSLHPSEFSWDQKSPGALVLLSQQDPSYKQALFAAIDSAIDKTRTPGGLTFFSEWGTNRYAANFALISLMAAKMEGLESSLGMKYYDYGMQQIHNMLGDGDNARSSVVGFGNNPPERPHHRASSCRHWTVDPNSRVCNSQDKDANGPNPQILYGALVGGPDQSGGYADDRNDYVMNEVATDYNAGFQSAVAGLKHFVMQVRTT